MKFFLPLLLGVVLLAAQSAAADQTESSPGEAKNARMHGMIMDCEHDAKECNKGDAFCSPEMRGRCDKRRGDWYGASQPVATATEARGLLINYFSGHEYTVSEVTEKKWGFKADIVNKDGKIVDRVMIDKRSGRIRSIN